LAVSGGPPIGDLEGPRNNRRDDMTYIIDLNAARLVNLYFDQRLLTINTVPNGVPWEDCHIFGMEGIRNSMAKGLWNGWWVHPSVSEGRLEKMNFLRKMQLFISALHHGRVEEKDLEHYL